MVTLYVLGTVFSPSILFSMFCPFLALPVRSAPRAARPRPAPSPGGDNKMEEAAHYADLVGGRARQWAVAFTFMDPAAKLELLCLVSFAVCVLGSLVVFPVAVNLAIALLGLSSCRSGSEAQLIAVCFFAVLTTVTDVVFMCTRPSTYGGFMTLLNLVVKLAAATQSYRLLDAGGRYGLSNDMPVDPIGDGGAYQPRADALAAPLAQEDYQALAIMT